MNLDISKFPEFDNHELVILFNNKTAGLEGIIAIHNTNLGPAAGATRYLNYPSKGAAISDALRLSRMMTYKCALAGVPFGGGKGVIIAHSKETKSRALLRAYAEKVNLLNGLFYTGQDVGMNRNDVRVMAAKTKFVIGKTNKSNNPPLWTAIGIFYAIQAGLESVFGSRKITGRNFAIKGLGEVGINLCRLIYKGGGNIIASDIDRNKVRLAKKKFPRVKIVSNREISTRRVDVYSPCALGGEFSKESIPWLRCKIICGGANNQLKSKMDGFRLYRAGILYIPDYLANAGGLINVVAELDRGGYNKKKVERQVKNIGRTTQKVIDLSLKRNKPTSEVADEIAESIFKHKAG